MIAILLTAFVLMSATEAADGRREPGIVKGITEQFIRLWHQEVVLGTELEKKLNDSQIPGVLGNLTTILESTKIDYELKDLQLKDYSKPEAELSINRSDGIWLTVHVKRIVLEGRHEIKVINEPWYQYEKQGDFVLRILGVTLKMRREPLIAGVDSTTIRWESSEGSVTIDDIEFDFQDQDLNMELANVDIIQLKQEVSDHMLKAYKNLTEVSYDATVNLSDNLYVDMMLMRKPNLYDGYMDFYYPGDIRYKGDNRIFTEYPEGIQFDTQFPSSHIELRMSNYTFDSLSYVTHNKSLLNYTYSSEDLPEGMKNLLDTTCERDCFGKMFKKSGDNFPRTSVELSVGTTSKNFLRVTIGKGTMRADLELVCTARARGADSQEPLFIASYNISFDVQPKITKEAKLHFEILRRSKSVKALFSTLGDLPQDKLLNVVELALKKVIIPTLTKLRLEGIEIKLPIPFLPIESEIILEPKEMRILLDFENKEVDQC